MTVLDMFRLEGKVALITGGARGLGRVMAQALAEAGAAVALTSRQAEHAERAALEIAEGTGTRTLGLAADVVQPEQVDTLVDQTLKHFNTVDILINNAGINIRAPIADLSIDDWNQVIDINLKGPWLCCRALAPIFQQKQSGRVINVSSMLGEVGLADRTPYCSSKGGLSLMTRTLALEWAPWNVNVNALCPGPFATEINQPLLSDPDRSAAIVSKIPLGRWGEPAEIGPATVFLASDASRFVTGTCLFIDGGFTAQ